MNNYKRITMREFAGVTGDATYNRLAELEDKIESGGLIDRNEYESARHRAEVAEKERDEWKERAERMHKEALKQKQLVSDSKHSEDTLRNQLKCALDMERLKRLTAERDDSKIEYRGYQTYIHYSAADKVLYGKIEGIKDLVNFESHSVTEIEKEFHKAVDDYIEFCREVGKSIDEVEDEV